MDKEICPRMRVREVAKRLGCSVSTVWAWVKKGYLPKPRKVGTKFSYWLRSEIEEIALGKETVNSI